MFNIQECKNCKYLRDSNGAIYPLRDAKILDKPAPKTTSYDILTVAGPPFAAVIIVAFIYRLLFTTFGVY